MRVNCEDGEHHWRLHFVRGPQVFLNGVEMRDCIEADEEEGYVIRHVRDVAGRLVVDGDVLRTERLRGSVELKGDRRG